MDTRSKIIASEEAHRLLAGRPAEWVAGHFDPLLAEHVRMLREHVAPGRLLVVEITNPARSLLAQRARAELVAALAMVDYVVLRNGQGASEPAPDASITERFLKHVRRRTGKESS